MELVLVSSGYLDLSQRMRESFGASLRVGLFQNDIEIDRETTIGSLQEADFSGYSGPQFITAWDAPYLDGERAILPAVPVTWTVAGGGISNWIFGFYVLDTGGNLLWAQRVGAAPRAMIYPGTTYTADPSLSVGSRYPLEEQ